MRVLVAVIASGLIYSGCSEASVASRTTSRSFSLMAVYLESRLAGADDEAARTRRRQRVLELEGPERASYFSDLFVADDRILLRGLSVEESGRWFEFNGDGSPIGFLPLPRGAKLLDMVDDLVLVQEVGPLDVPSAVLYSFGARR